MKLKNVEDGVKLSSIKVKLTDSLYDSSSLPEYDIKTKEVYLVGNMMGDFFVKIDPESDQVYPMFNDLLGWDVLKDLEVIQIDGND